MKHFLLYIIVLLAVVSSLDVQGKSYYNSAANNFGGLFPHPGMRMQGRYKDIEGDRLVESNASMATALCTDTMMIHSTAYRYQLRLANLNNKQGKTVSVKNPMNNSKTTITNSQWGLVFDFDQYGNYYAVVLSCDNSTPYDDITDERTMHISLIECKDGKPSQVTSTTVRKGVSLEDDLNTICVDVDEHGVTVSVGKDELNQVLEAQIKRTAGTVQVGYLIGPGARVSIERAVLTIDNEQQVAIQQSSWTRESLDEYFSQSADPVEGYWKYLDRDMQNDWLRLGGRYTLALVRADNGYDLIYIDGAQVKKSLWQPGMVKGHMTKTLFTGNYDLNWIDATMEPIDSEAYSTVENGVILTLYFPMYSSQVRFAKAINPDE